MFADDTNMFISGRNLLDLTNTANIELGKISSWFSTNLLSLNIKKTNYILFGNRRLSAINLLINGEHITRVFETKFLGVSIQANLKWNTHIELIINKICKTVGIINKIKHILAQPHLKNFIRVLLNPT
jgi:hypothetical protein